MGTPSTGSISSLQLPPPRSSASSQASIVCWSSQSWRSDRSIWVGQVWASSPEPASQAAVETEVASSTPVPSPLRRTGRLATVTTTANRSSCGGSTLMVGSSPCPVAPCSTVPSAAVPTRISQRGPVNASSRPYHGNAASR